MDKKRALELQRQMNAEGKLPKELYKHTTISNNLYKTLVNAELWFAAPTSFNDPFDCQINDQTDWTDANIREYVTQTALATGQKIDPEAVVRTNQQSPGSFKEFFTDNLKGTLSKQGVACFLPNANNLLLWAHYSASHTGVCLKFDRTQDESLFALTFAVHYSQDYPRFDYLSERNDLVIKAMLTKSIHWKYENEIRVFKTNIGNHPFEKESLKEIIFGCKAAPNEITTIRRLVDNAHYPDLKLRQVKLKDNEYDVEIVDL
ncbi:MAG: DUF2971 domain-containing protein [Ignavibacteria bacterium]|nr:DUF2971 domain-containing protein [Ignavibacteria bacterium]MBK6418818.1 DUF2971 domain-containing protein [Ignavibacteria bacterium]MBK6760663.1 DUF2971 domain-containing protein [Ignavibacteria bacterium]MBK7576314.1 DUF2971 domain-containing protein [Ignavibacteria bacterium]